VAGGRLAISELGDWTDIALDAAFTDQAIELRTLEARRGKGRVSARGALRGLDTPSATLQGQLDARRLTITRTGETVATLDLGVKASGTYQASKLKVRLDVPQGTVKLPPRQPRDLQSLDKRPDIVVGQRPERKRPREAPARPGPAAGAGAGAGAAPFALEVRAVAPGPLQVNQDNPRVRLDLKADVTYERQGGEEYMTGTVEVIRGDVEPIGGRRFEVARGRVTFTGGPPKAALLDVEAIYKNPQATVTVGVTGPLSSPDIRLSSKPPMDDAQIAMLIATGRTELKPGGGGVASGTGSSKGLATVGGLVATNLFKSVIQDKLPLDTVALDSSEVQAGKYVADGKVYVGYTRRFDAQTDQGENLNEVRVEYQISPRWTFESRYGDAQSGGASLIWSKDY
jgi:translocation and assembly module TamB